MGSSIGRVFSRILLPGLLFAGLFVAGCGGGPPAPRITSIAPSTVTNLASTAATIHGRNFLNSADASVDGGSANLSTTWVVKIGATPLAPANVQWTDPAAIDVTLPAGLAPGVYDVTAVSPSGRATTLAGALTVTDLPVGLALSIEDAPGGAGSPVGARSFAAGETLVLYAVLRDAGGAFVTDQQPVDWSVLGGVGALDVGAPAVSTIFTAERVGVGSVEATDPSAGAADAGPLTIDAGPAVRVAVETSAGGLGLPVGAMPSLTTDDALAVHAIERDAFGNFVADGAAGWSVSGGIGSIAAGPSPGALLDLTRPGSGAISASVPSLPLGTSGTLTVAPGRVATMAVSPPTLSISADAAATGFTAAASDADGNATTNVGTVTWSISSGAISAIDPATGAFDPKAAGSGTVRASSSLGPFADSGTVTVTPGRAATLAVSPPTLSISADAAPTAFAASGADADGNATTDLGTIAWSISSGPITAIDPVTGSFDPTAAGTGTVRATSSYGPFKDSGAVVVAPGKAASLAVAPTTLTISADAPPAIFHASGADADGNATTDLGALAWTISSGPISAIVASSGAGSFDPTAAGTGTVRVTSAYGPFADSGAVTVTPGKAAALSVDPPTLNTSVGAPATQFMALGVDGDGNATSDVGSVGWSVSSGSLSSLDPATGLFTPAVVSTGSIRASSSYGSFADSGRIAVTSTVNHAPLACFSVAATSGTAGVTGFAFDASCSSDVEDATAALQVRWDFTSDGTWDTTFGATKTASVVYASAGTLTVTVQVRDTGGYSTLASHRVVVYPAGGEVLVTTPTDESDPGATPSNPGGTGFSLREAIGWVNSLGTAKVIRFAGPMTCRLATSVLPALTAPGASIVGGSGVTIDANSVGSAAVSCVTLAGSNEELDWVTLTNCGGFGTVRIDGNGGRVAESTLTLGSGGATTGVVMGAVDDVTGPNDDISGFNVNNSSYGVYFVLGPAPGTHTVDGNRIHANRNGVETGGYSGSVIQRNDIYSNASNGITMLNSESAATIRFNVIDGNSGDGVHMGNTSSHDVRDNLLTNNGGYGINSTSTFVDPNGFFGNGSGAIKGATPAASSTTADPLFVNRAGADFRLQPASPCVNRGVDLGLDVNGLLPGDFNGGAPDFGASETPY